MILDFILWATLGTVGLIALACLLNAVLDMAIAIGNFVSEETSTFLLLILVLAGIMVLDYYI